jgi:acetyl esterase/lipase
MLKRLAVLILMLVATPAMAQRAGTLVSATPVAAPVAGVRAWKMRYWTSGQRGPIQVMGMVLAPTHGQGERPVIAWTHGAWGVAESCAPSLSSNFWKMTAAVDAVARGYTVVAPDYRGLGSKGTHPFLVGEAAARDTLDAVRAARSIRGAGAGERFAIWGESQGGHAALWTGLEAARYAPELRLVGVAALVPPTDLIANLRGAREPNVKALFTALIASSWHGYYGAPINFGRPRTAGIISKFAAKCITLDARPNLAAIVGMLTLRADLRNVDLGNVQPWARLAAENNVPIRQPGAPLFVATSDGDVLVSADVVQNYARGLCAARTGPVRFTRLTKADHVGITGELKGQVLDWIGARFAGRPPPSDCGRF